MAKVMIEKDLFMALLNYHLANDRSKVEYIEKGLEEKLGRMAAHEGYSRSLTTGKDSPVTGVSHASKEV